MGQQFLFRYAVPTIILSCGVLFAGWLSTRNTAPEQSTQPTVPPLVETIQFAPRPTGFEIQVGGNVVPRREVTLSARVSGTVVRKDEACEQGRWVRHGTPLIHIDPTEYEIKVEELLRAAEQIESDLQRLKVEETSNLKLIELATRQLELANKELARNQGLVEKEAITDAELEASIRSELEARSALTQLQNLQKLLPVQRQRLDAELKTTRLKQRQAQLRVDYTSVSAPLDGIVSFTEVEPGDYVQAGDVLLRIEETNAVEVECHLRSSDLYWLWNAEPRMASEQDDAHRRFEIPDFPVTVSYSVAGQKFHWQGRLSRYSGTGIDPDTRTVPCRVVVEQPQVRPTPSEQGEPAEELSARGPERPVLMRGMFVTVSIEVIPRTPLWKIPTAAIQPNTQVWSVDRGRLKIHEIHVERQMEDGVLVRAATSELRAGDRLVVTSLMTAFQGMPVRIAEQEKASDSVMDKRGASSP